MDPSFKQYKLSEEQLRQMQGSLPFKVVDHWLSQFREKVKTRCTWLDLKGGKYILPPERENELLALLATAYDKQNELDERTRSECERRISALDQAMKELLEKNVYPMAEGLQNRELEDWEVVRRKAECSAKTGEVKSNTQKNKLFKAIADQRNAVESEMKKQLDESDSTTFFLVEQRTPVFLFVIDMDLAEPVQRIEEATLRDYCLTIQETLRRFYGRTFELVVCSVLRIEPLRDKVKTKGKLDEVLYKHGYHIYATDLWVTDVQALTIRELLLTLLHDRFGPRTVLDNDWTQVIDNCIYVGNGIRPPYASKVSRPPCKGKACPLCRGKENINHAIVERWRRYVPWRVFSIDALWDEQRLKDFENSHYALRALSLRSDGDREPTEGYARPKEAPEYFPALKRLEALRSIDRQLEDTEDELQDSDEHHADEYQNDEECSSKMRNRRLIHLELSVFRELQHHIRDFALIYRSIVVQKTMIVNNPNPYLLVHVRGAGSQYCHNKGGEHHGNRIWFHISKLGIIQKCFCRCPTTAGRVRGLCSTYKSIPKELPISLVERIFPNIILKNVEQDAKRLKKSDQDLLFTDWRN